MFFLDEPSGLKRIPAAMENTGAGLFINITWNEDQLPFNSSLFGAVGSKMLQTCGGAESTFTFVNVSKHVEMNTVLYRSNWPDAVSWERGIHFDVQVIIMDGKIIKKKHQRVQIQHCCWKSKGL